jgi:hypothetical protein
VGIRACPSSRHDSFVQHPTPFVMTLPTVMTAADLNAAIASGALTLRRLPTAHGARTNRWANQIKGGSTRVRTHGGAAGSSATRMTTANSALADVR